jgi:hypothetical protein
LTGGVTSTIFNIGGHQATCGRLVPPGTYSVTVPSPFADTVGGELYVTSPDPQTIHVKPGTRPTVSFTTNFEPVVTVAVGGPPTPTTGSVGEHLNSYVDGAQATITPINGTPGTPVTCTLTGGVTSTIFNIGGHQATCGRLVPPGTYSVTVPSPFADTVGGELYVTSPDPQTIHVKPGTRPTVSFTTKLPTESQTINFTSIPPSDPTVGGTYDVAATATSGLPVTFTIDASSTPGACSVSGTAVSFTSTGLCVVDANQAGNSNFEAAPQVDQSMSVGPPGATSSSTGTSTTQTGTASASDDGTSVVATGTGSVTVASDSAAPPGTYSIGNATAYFDVSVGNGSTFSSLTIEDCNLGGGTELEWWNGSSWVPVSPVTGPSGTPPCLTATLNSSSTPTIAQLTGTPFAVVTIPGYWTVTASGVVHAFGTVGTFGSLPRPTPHAQGREPHAPPGPPPGPVVGMASTPDGQGYWLVEANGTVVAFGDAAAKYCTGGTCASAPATPGRGGLIVGIATNLGGKGYWLVGANGTVYALSGAPTFGSLPQPTPRTQGREPHAPPGPPPGPVVGMASTPDGQGYWLVEANGTVVAFGNAAAKYCTGGTCASAPATPGRGGLIVGIATNLGGKGYWLVAANGTVYALSGATTFGSLPRTTPHAQGREPHAPPGPPPGPVVGMASTPDGQGYWLVEANGTVVAFGAATTLGSSPPMPGLLGQVVAIASVP